MLDAWVAGVQGLLQVRELMFLSLGMGIGLVFGALPGLGGATALALLMPLTYGLEPFTAVALAVTGTALISRFMNVVGICVVAVTVTV